MALFFYKEKNKDIRAAAYLRLSIEDGDKAESNSIGNQRELIRDFVAERPELHLVGEYADDGYTGTNFERPGFTQMMEDIKSGKINCIIVKDLSRLGRNYIEMGKYLEQIFPMMGIRFIAINDNYDNANTESSDSDSIVVPFKNLLNDSYCRDISIKVRSQLDIKRRKGEFIGGYAMYGYCKDERNKSRLVVDEYLHCITNHNGLGCSSHLISESKLAEVVLAALQGKIQQISGLEQRLDEINEIPKNQRRLKSVEEHMKMLEQEEQKYQTLRRQLYEDMSSGIVSKDEYKEFSRSFNEKVENICKAKTEMNRQLDSLSNLDVEHLPWIEDFKSYQNLTSLNRRVLVELVESITVYDKEHIHIQYRFDQEIRNVLEYCNSVPTTETEGSTV